MNAFNPELCHEYSLQHMSKALACNDELEYGHWRSMVRNKLNELIGARPEQVQPHGREASFFLLMVWKSIPHNPECVCQSRGFG